MTITTYQVTGMSCGHCETAVRSEVAKIDGVERIDVSATDGVLTIESATPLVDADVLAAVDEAGYDAVRA
ncbi:heavy-metal-associated domain-containing protein [Microbacterium sp. C7(2022)]|uniref:heavy-metal-associated domain-containing protein n=1 Tax=Microbacterium sp. C7(2022) TaxID=2992759 RepID=UPI00237B1793|nr:heavy-metal-associated domain-containing protein [Microbacterium sp. C7(2022)]MDE0547689.1 heavy-metal-associated domain-containing protein [Microbacterium sp. C7(2022)]